jgi:hypothetical protein
MNRWAYKIGGIKLREETEVLSEKPIAVPLFPSQIPHGLGWDRTRTSTKPAN